MLITIPGKVKAKERPRRGKYGQFYTPKDTQDYEALVEQICLAKGLKPVEKPYYIGIGLKFYGKYPLSDIDNLIKSVLDGFRRFFNDNRVIRIAAEKIPHPEYKTEVEITSLTENT
jgi:Holliday junction resolvase RusA-like endonuclease